HSDAQLVEVVLGARTDGWFFVEVKDDGRGSDSDIGKRKPGLGSLGMRERAVILGARLDVQSVPGGGTSVRASLPKEK
ncbi:MAG: ATP-binding protein, partial [Candidatus Dormiibacterota bacterium]